MRGGVATGDVVEQLSLDVGEQRAGPESEEAAVQPVAAQLLLHQEEPDERLLRRADAARRLETHLDGGGRRREEADGGREGEVGALQAKRAEKNHL